jgi:hypothetical protein
VAGRGTLARVLCVLDRERMSTSERIAPHTRHLPRHLHFGRAAGDREPVAGDLARDIEPWGRCADRRQLVAVIAVLALRNRLPQPTLQLKMVNTSDQLSRLAGLSAFVRPDVTILVILSAVAAAVGAFAVIGPEAAVCTFAAALALSSRLAGPLALASPTVTILVILLAVAASIGAFAVISLEAAVCTFATALAPVSC